MTPRRRELLLYIEAYMAVHGSAPSWSEVGRYFRVSYQYVRKEMLILQTMGYIKWERYAPATLTVVRLPQKKAA